MNIGDTVVCHVPGSWVDGKTATILKLDIISSEEIEGHQLQVGHEGVTVVPEFQLQKKDKLICIQ